MLLKNLRPADEYDRFASQALEPWDVLFVTRIRQIARDLPPGALVDIGTATVVVPVRLAADPVLKGWHLSAWIWTKPCSKEADRASKR